MVFFQNGGVVCDLFSNLNFNKLFNKKDKKENRKSNTREIRQVYVRLLCTVIYYSFTTRWKWRQIKNTVLFLQKAYVYIFKQLEASVAEWLTVDYQLQPHQHCEYVCESVICVTF